MLGKELFCYIKLQKGLNSDINFQNIFYALFTLFRVATSENWYLILADTSRANIQVNFWCKEIYDFEDFFKYGLNGCGTKYAYFFFYTFIIFSLLLLNLLVGEMLNISATLKKQEEKVVSIYQLDDIVKLWAQFDPQGFGLMNYKDFWKFCSKIAVILGLKTQEFLNLETKKKFLKLLELPVYESSKGIFCFMFFDVVIVLSKLAVLTKMNQTKF